jgi:hypothetical protein
MHLLFVRFPYVGNNERDVMDEIQGYFAGQVLFEDLSQMAKLFVTTLRTGDVRSIHAGFGVVDRTSEQDAAGPFTRITWTIDALSGPERKWVSVADLAGAVLKDTHVAEWVTSIAGSSEQAEIQRVITAAVDTWCSMILTEELATDFGIELSFDENGPVWRTIHHPNAIRSGVEALLIERLVEHYGGRIQTDVEGRSQISLHDLEVYVGRDSTRERSSFTLSERPVVVSVLAGVELIGDQWREVVTEWVNDPALPQGFLVELVTSTGTQVWVDRVIDGDSIAQFDELITNARVLTAALEPWEHNPR